MRRICLFCGASSGRSPIFNEAAAEFGRALASRGQGLVFGGGRVGLMGVAADAALAAGGDVIGVIPRALCDLEVAHTGLDDLRVVESMHERKQLMHNLSDGFVALPGGHGTLDEVFETITWAQLGYHTKPVGLLNLEGFFDPLLAMLDRSHEEGFIPPRMRELWLVEARVPALLERLENYQAPVAARWLGPGDP
ncbi:MAG: TIGR00730 family Rossman fold protein [bacterium]|jgi:hypothetical protein|nr:TIGR00730 family Rossman fold protein [Planctomycetota bacterium]HIL53236.1 TIGR00730 family Rossman fold protein [Planctomycetota bacterium]